MQFRWILLLAAAACLQPPKLLPLTGRITRATSPVPSILRSIKSLPDNVTKLLPAWTFSVQAEPPPARARCTTRRDARGNVGRHAHRRQRCDVFARGHSAWWRWMP